MIFKLFDKDMKVYFVTHSTSKDNEAKIASGWKDTELSEIGIQQAKDLGKRFKSIKIDLICCSDLKRAVDTVKIAFGEKYPVIVDKRLREINYGDFNGKPKKLIDSIKEKHIKTPFPNGESYEQAVARVQEFFKELKKKYPDKIVLVVGHRATQYGLEIMTGQKTLKECLKTPFKWQPYWEYDF
jgi:broad specificity phosphatase PhoE